MTTQGMTIGKPSGPIPVDTTNTADNLLMFVNQLSVPQLSGSMAAFDGRDNIGHISLMTGDSLSPDTKRAMASVHFDVNHHQVYIPVNSASTPVLKGESYDWKLSTTGEDCQTAEAAMTFPLTLPSNVSPTGWQTVPLDQPWEPTEDGFLVGFIEKYSDASIQVIVSVQEPGGSPFQISGASVMWGTDVYLPANTFSLPVYNGCTISFICQDHTGTTLTDLSSIHAYWIGFGETSVFEAGYAALNINETYEANSDLFVIGLAAATQDGARLKLSAGTGTDMSSPDQVVLGASVNCSKNRWLQYTSLLLPVPKTYYYNTTSTVSGSPVATAYCLQVLTLK